jgi:hypothetical protein
MLPLAQVRLPRFGRSWTIWKRKEACLRPRRRNPDFCRISEQRASATVFRATQSEVDYFRRCVDPDRKPVANSIGYDQLTSSTRVKPRPVAEYRGAGPVTAGHGRKMGSQLSPHKDTHHDPPQSPVRQAHGHHPPGHVRHDHQNVDAEPEPEPKHDASISGTPLRATEMARWIGYRGR